MFSYCVCISPRKEAEEQRRVDGKIVPSFENYLHQSLVLASRICAASAFVTVERGRESRTRKMAEWMLVLAPLAAREPLLAIYNSKL